MFPRRYFPLILLWLCCGGCLWSGHGPASPSVLSAPDAVSVEVIRDDLWAAGGSVVFIPFTPGANAEACPVVDRLSLMIVKGAADVFTERGGKFSFITDGDAQKAQFVIEGRIEEFDTGSRWKAFGVGKKDVTLKIKGEVREHKTGEVVALIFGYKAFKKTKDSERVAYELGRSLGEKVQH